MSVIDAVYQNGVFRPITPPDLPDGTSVQVVLPDPPTPPPYTPAEVYAMLKAIADLPEEAGGDKTITARDHDKALYGGPNGAL